MKQANRNLLVRVLSALVLGPPVAALVIWRRPEGFALLAHLAVAVALGELYWITLRESPVWMRLAGVALGLLASVTMYWSPRADLLVAVLMVSVITAANLNLLHPQPLDRAAAAAGQMVFGLLYVPLLLTPLALLKRMPEGADWVFLVMLVTWMSDTGAYFAGRAFGRHKLYPRVSPGKTWEGAAGGLLFSFGGAALAKLWFMPQIGWLDAALIALPGGALGQVGDLVESMIKRAYGVKDSGRTIPGHGGLLDRIDALLFVSAYVYLYARYAM